MVDRRNQRLIQGGKNEPIVRFEVWWQTPFGLFLDIKEAIKKLDETDMDIEGLIRPVSVAVGTTTYEVIGG